MSDTESWLGRHGPYILLLVFLYYCLQIAVAMFGDWFDLYEMLPIMADAIVVLMVAALVGVVVRVIVQVVRHASWTRILRTILGEPSWWRTWYPRVLRDPASVWDRLPPALKVLRTVFWLELLLLPAGFLLAIFVLPTFEAVFASLGMAFPLMMRTVTLAVTIGVYVLPLFAVAAVVQGRRWRAEHGLSPMVAFGTLFSVSPDFWQDTEAGKLLRH
jgi:hypothetical protein